jgi:hypothetical protein
VLTPAPIQESNWVSSMHEYHRRTGLYRADDPNRVLGDPRDQVSGPSVEDFALALAVPMETSSNTEAAFPTPGLEIWT